MKATVIILSVLAITLGSPIDETIDWHNIKPINLVVEPSIDAPVLPAGRIHGGQVAPRNSIPYQAGIVLDRSGFCGGSLIATDIILTAAHCIVGNTQSQVILGAHNRTIWEPTQRIEVSSDFIVHPAYGTAGVQFDVALIRIARVSLTPEIQVIPLAPSNAETYAGQTGVASGWGMTSTVLRLPTELRRVNLQIITNDVCDNSFRNNIKPQHICTSGQGRVGACSSDSGGPLVVNGVQVGIVSFGSPECGSGNPTVFARVSYFRNWISQNGGI